METAESTDRHDLFTGDQQISTKYLPPKAVKVFRLVFYVGCATSIMLVILVGIVSFTALNRQEKLEKWVEHTYYILRKTDSVNAYFNQALQPARDKNPADAELSGLSAEEQRNLENQIYELQSLVKDNAIQLKQTQLLQQQTAALRPVDRHNIQALRARIVVSINRIRQMEEALLSTRENAYKKSGKQTQYIIVGGSLLILIIVSILIYVILTELKNRIRALQEEHELNQLKSSFVTLASHEFRTPLSSVLLSASLIEKYIKQYDTEPILKHTAKIKQVIHNLEGILEDFLSLEKLEEGQVKAEFTSFDLGELCREIMAAMKLMAKPNQQLIYEPAHLTDVVVLDYVLLGKALNGLISNAIKYAGNEAVIRLVTEVTGDAIVVSVKDNGVGIAEEDQKKLATSFYRINNTGHISGTGLGLHIVKQYVALMHGTLHVSSVPNVETCFQMKFPVRVR